MMGKANLVCLCPIPNTVDIRQLTDMTGYTLDSKAGTYHVQQEKFTLLEDLFTLGFSRVSVLSWIYSRGCYVYELMILY